jgi:hypothetical protein
MPQNKVSDIYIQEMRPVKIVKAQGYKKACNKNPSGKQRGLSWKIKFQRNLLFPCTVFNSLVNYGLYW